MNLLTNTEDLEAQIAANMSMNELIDLRKGISHAMHTILRSINVLPQGDLDENMRLEVTMVEHCAIISSYYGIYTRAI